MPSRTQTPPTIVKLDAVETGGQRQTHAVTLPDYEPERFEDMAFLTAMTMVLMGNYSRSGHFGGPLAYTPYNVAAHLGGPELGGLRYDLRRPKHPFADRFLLAGGHGIPTCYALWMILYEAMARQHAATGEARYACDPEVAILPIDALGFRRSAGAVKNLLADQGLAEDPLFAQAKLRGIRALAGHSETTDATNDVNGGPSGIGFSTAAGKALFWDSVNAPEELKVLVCEGEFAMCEGHAQEIKTIALAQQVGKRLRVMLSFNNAGIDDELVGSVIPAQYGGYDLAQQWAAYGWNVLSIADGNNFDEIFAALKTMEDWPAEDRRPMILVGPTTKGWWPAAVDGRIPGNGEQIVGAASHPYTLPMNGEYFQALAGTFESRFGLRFEGIRDGQPANEAERLTQFMTNMKIALSALDERPGLRDWITDRILAIADTVDDKTRVSIPTDRNLFADERLAVAANLPTETQSLTLADPQSGAEVTRKVDLFLPPGQKRGSRRAISEIGKWLNYVTEGHFFTMAADLSDSINVEKSHFFDHYDPVENPAGTRLKAAIQEAGNTGTILGLISQSVSADPEVHAGVWGLSGTYGAFTPLMYTPARVFSQQKQDSPFAIGVATILAGHSGPETAADARTHFGIFAPQIWTLFPRGQVINLYFWDYNDVAPGYFAAVAKAVRSRETGIIVIHVARPDFPVADRANFADTELKSAAKGIYLIRDFAPDQPAMGTVLVQGSSSSYNLVQVLPRLAEAGINVRVAAVISEELFADQAPAYRESVFPDSARYDCMVVSTMTKRVMPLPNLGPLTEEYSLTADHDDRWRTGGTEADVIAEAKLDTESIFAGVSRFAREREERLNRQRRALESL